MPFKNRSALNQYKWNKDQDGYAIGTVNNKLWRLYRYIMIELLNNDIIEKQPVDHINNERLDNTIENLRISTHSENSRNRKKQENCTSKYMGVCIKNNKFQVSLRINGKRLLAIYVDENHAAYQYNLWVDEYNLTTTPKNSIEIPNDFIKYTSRVSLKELPSGISYTQNKKKFIVGITINYKTKHLGTFDTLEEAIEVRQNAEKQRDMIFKERVLAISKTFNELSQCIFKIKDTEIIIDEELFYDIIKYNWRLDKNNYVNGEINGKAISLTRFVTKYSGNDLIDHIDRNPLNNRKDNLRIVTAKQNTMNKSSAKNSSSKHVGVCFRKDSKKWRAYIRVNNKNINIGTFVNEIDAAKARDEATKKYFGEFGNLNLE